MGAEFHRIKIQGLCCAARTVRRKTLIGKIQPGFRQETRCMWCMYVWDPSNHEIHQHFQDHKHIHALRSAGSLGN